MIHRYTVGTLECGDVNKKERRYDIRPRTEVNAKPSSLAVEGPPAPRAGEPCNTRVPTLPEGRPSGNVFLGQVERRCFGLGEGGLGGRARVFHSSLGSCGADCVVVARGTVCFVVELTFSQTK